MWRDLLNWMRIAWQTGTQTEKNTTRIEELTAQNQALVTSFDRLSNQQQHDREMSESRVRLAEERINSLEKEIESLRREFNIGQANTEMTVRYAISEYLRQLPPPNTDK